MAFLNICGFETGDLSEVASSSGSVSVQSTVKRTGSYAVKFTLAGTNGWVVLNKLAATGVPAELGLTTAYITAYLYNDSFPGVTNPVLHIQDSAGSDVVRVFFDSSNRLFLNGVASSGTSAALSTGQWYRLDLTVVSNGTSTLSIDGGSGLTCTANNVTIDRVVPGNKNGGTHTFYYDDIAISDSALPGAGQVNILKPNGTGNYTAWTDGAGTAPTNVAEVPHDSDTGYITSSTATQAETEALDSAATGGVAGTIGTVKSVVIVRDEAGVSSLNIRTRSNTTDQDTTAVDPGATYTLLGKLNDTDPATSAAWTSGGLDALEVGVLNNNAVAVRCTAAYAMVWCTGASAAPVFRRALLGVGV